MPLLKPFVKFWCSLRLTVSCLITALVLVFVGTQLSIPLIILYTIDHALRPTAGAVVTLGSVVAVFACVVAVNYAANFLQEMLVG